MPDEDKTDAAKETNVVPGTDGSPEAGPVAPKEKKAKAQKKRKAVKIEDVLKSAIALALDVAELYGEAKHPKLGIALANIRSCRDRMKEAQEG